MNDTQQDAAAFQTVELPIAKGRAEGHLYGVGDKRAGVISVGGAGGGWDTPARGLYPRLAADLLGQGITSLRVKFRNPRDLDSATEDVLAGVLYLVGLGIERIALIGHSFGGAVVIRAAAVEPRVAAVVALAPQSYGAEPAARLSPSCRLLLVHGTEDTVLSPENARYIASLASAPTRLVLHPGAGHVLDEAAEAVEAETREWILGALGA